MLDNECSISPLYGLIGELGGFSGPVSIHILSAAGIAGTTFGGLLVTVLYVLMPNNNPFLHPEHW